MISKHYEQVCYRTEQREESLPLRHMRDGRLGYTLGCTPEGETVQVRLVNGELDSWSRDECMESF
ncbi:conserved hypothetical protein [Trichlorobacter lovleyi SZ]|uniref:Uncharacterized protein n=1 Tax=Trichlorobacter lovleyi (strain ATCC BAA-1151 / DSM 17278 / SZ) TaxID=398767 RepID=B3E1W4_TRIL1|nr:conserved hypothetical protein [Trichlorobacter lovleyi SZ]